MAVPRSGGDAWGGAAGVDAAGGAVGAADTAGAGSAAGSAAAFAGLDTKSIRLQYSLPPLPLPHLGTPSLSGGVGWRYLVLRRVVHVVLLVLVLVLLVVLLLILRVLVLPLVLRRLLLD